MRRQQIALLILVTATCGCGAKESTTEADASTTSAGSDLPIVKTDLNGDWRSRDRLLGIAVRWGKDDSGGVFDVDRIDLKTLQQLISSNFIDPTDQQNEAPTVAEIAEFMRDHPGTYAFGYAVNPTRPDYRVSLEGIVVPEQLVTPTIRDAAATFCGDADEYAFDSEIYCWWD